MRVLQRRPANRIDVWEPNRYLRVLTTIDGLVLVEVENRGTIDEPDVRLYVRSGNPSAATRLGLAQTVRTSERLCRRLAMISGVSPLHVRADDGEQVHLERAHNWLFELALAQAGDCAVALSASSDAQGAADAVRVLQLRASASGG